MLQLVSQLGIDWHLLVAQAVNFFLLLTILRMFVYKPLLKMMHDRQMRIEGGLMKADEADRRLHEVDEMNIGKIKATENRMLEMMKHAESEAKVAEARMLAEAKRKEAEALKNTEVLLKAREEEARRASEKEAAALVRRAITKTVELAPGAIDDAMIAKAVEEARKTASPQTA